MSQLGTSDTALLHAATVCGAEQRHWHRLVSGWRERLGTFPSPFPTEAECAAALAALRREHQAAVRPDFTRIHPTWLARALKDEPSSVVRAVAFAVPEPLAGTLRAVLGWDRQSFLPDHRPHPETLAWVQALWAERLVGGPPPSDADPLAIRALTALGRPARAQLLSLVGLAKHAYDPAAEVSPAWTVRQVQQFRAFQDDWGDRDPRLLQVARLDVHERAALRDLMRLGLVSVARLLAVCEPFRVRWALQHLPYDIAKVVRSWTRDETPFVPAALLREWETRLLQSSWDRSQGDAAEGAAP
jgi:hypothetical protein